MSFERRGALARAAIDRFGGGNLRALCDQKVCVPVRKAACGGCGNTRPPLQNAA